MYTYNAYVINMLHSFQQVHNEIRRCWFRHRRDHNRFTKTFTQTTYNKNSSMAHTTSTNFSSRKKRNEHDKSYGNDKNDSMTPVAIDRTSSPASCVDTGKQYKTVRYQKAEENEYITYPSMD